MKLFTEKLVYSVDFIEKFCSWSVQNFCADAYTKQLNHNHKINPPDNKMKYSAIILSLITATTSTFAADERSAAQIARKFSETIACQIQDTQIQRNQYKAVKVLQGDKDLGGLGDIFVVYWEGDIGCAGGNGTVTANFTVVEQKGFSTVPPVVVLDYTFPELDLAQVTNISGKSGSLQINGIAYGPNDQQGYPTKRVAYNLKLDQASGAFVKR